MEKLNFILFQTAWWAIVVGASHGYSLLLAPIAFFVLAIHLIFLTHDFRFNETIAILVCASIGICGDFLVSKLRIMVFSSGAALPLWLCLMWIIFPTTLAYSMAWFRDRTRLALFLGGISGPLTYYAGKSFGLIEFPLGELSLIALGAYWAILLPSLVATYWMLRNRS